MKNRIAISVGATATRFLFNYASIPGYLSGTRACTPQCASLEESLAFPAYKHSCMLCSVSARRRGFPSHDCLWAGFICFLRIRLTKKAIIMPK